VVVLCQTNSDSDLGSQGQQQPQAVAAAPQARPALSRCTSAASDLFLDALEDWEDAHDAARPETADSDPCQQQEAAGRAGVAPAVRQVAAAYLDGRLQLCAAVQQLFALREVHGLPAVVGVLEQLEGEPQPSERRAPPPPPPAFDGASASLPGNRAATAKLAAQEASVEALVYQLTLLDSVLRDGEVRRSVRESQHALAWRRQRRARGCGCQHPPSAPAHDPRARCARTPGGARAAARGGGGGRARGRGAPGHGVLHPLP